MDLVTKNEFWLRDGGFVLNNDDVMCKQLDTDLHRSKVLLLAFVKVKKRERLL